MLRKLRVTGFKSLADVTVGFPRLSVLFGPNSAGKSNLLEANTGSFGDRYSAQLHERPEGTTRSGGLHSKHSRLRLPLTEHLVAQSLQLRS